MSVIRDWIEVEAPAEEVWDVVSDPRNLPRWNHYIRGVHDVPEDGLRAGSGYTAEVGALGVSFSVRADVEDIDPPRFARVRLSGPVEATVRTWIRPIGSRRSRLEHEVEYRMKGGPLGEFVARGLRVMGAPMILRHSLRAQKRHVEDLPG